MPRLPLQLGVMLLVLVAGCQWPPKTAPVAPPKCALRDDATKDEIIQHLNNNITKVTAWRSDNVTISTTTPAGIPIRLSAALAVESPRNFRLVARSLLGYEADFGSNKERFWFWMKRTKPKHVYTVRHDDFDTIRGRYPIPFRPDWLMEALGVVPLDPTQFIMQPRVADSTIVSLVAHQRMPDGRTARRVVLVDSCAGQIIKQTLYDSAGRTIASAEFNDFRFDPASQVTLAHQISLDWPQTQTSMTLRVHTVEINPDAMSPEMWQLPQYNNYSELDLAKQLGQVATLPPRSTRRDFTPRGRSAPTVDQVGRVKIGRVQLPPAGGFPGSSTDRPSDDRPAFADEQSRQREDRPQFQDELPPADDRRQGFAVPIPDRGQRDTHNDREAPGIARARPFPG